MKLVGKKKRRPPRAVRWKTSWDPAEPCPGCDLTYATFRTGLTYGEVRSQFWRHDEDRSTWVNKRRGSVLGRWHQIKMEFWDRHKAGCTSADHLEEAPF